MEQEREEFQREITEKIKELSTLNQKVRAVALNNVLFQKKELDEQLQKEMQALHLKYEKLSTPLYQEQQQIISGQNIPQDKVANLKEYLNEEELTQSATVLENQTAIEEYWLKCMKNSDLITAEIKEKDEAILKHLVKIEYSPSDDPLKFTINFTFSENEYFTNTLLTKTFELKTDDEPIKGEGTEIDWKEGKNVTVKKVQKTQKNKKTGAKRVIEKTVPEESFFNFFETHIDDEDDEQDDDDDEELKGPELLSIDYDIARGLIDEVIPYSLEYYLQVRIADEDDYDDDMEDDEDFEEENKKKGKKSKKSTDSTDGNKGQKPKEECKQQ